MGFISERVFWKHIYVEIHCALYNRIVLNVGWKSTFKGFGFTCWSIGWMICFYLIGPHLSKGLKGTSNKMVNRQINHSLVSHLYALSHSVRWFLELCSEQNESHHTKGLENIGASEFFSLSIIMLEVSWAFWKMWREWINIKAWMSIFKCGLNLSPL